MPGVSKLVSYETGAGLIFNEHLGGKPDPRLLAMVRTLGNHPSGTAIPFPSPDLAFQQTPSLVGPRSSAQLLPEGRAAAARELPLREDACPSHALLSPQICPVMRLRLPPQRGTGWSTVP